LYDLPSPKDRTVVPPHQRDCVAEGLQCGHRFAADPFFEQHLAAAASGRDAKARRVQSRLRIHPKLHHIQQYLHVRSLEAQA
jgi:hypothetical protein